VRKKIVTVVAAGALSLSGLALAGPALAAVGVGGATGSAATSVSAAVTSRVDRVKQALTGLVTDGTLTQTQADKVAGTLASTDLGGGRHHGRGAPDLAAAATALGLSPADLRTALQSGKSLAQVAQDKGVPVATLVDALVAREKTEIAKAVTDGRITQAQADTRLAGLTARVTERVSAVRPAGPGVDGAGHDGAGHDGGGPDGAGHDGAGHDGAGPDDAAPAPGQAG